MKQLKFMLIFVIFQLAVLSLYQNTNRINKEPFSINSSGSCNQTIPLLIQFVNSKKHKNLTFQLKRFLDSIVDTSKCLIDLHVITDDYGEMETRNILNSFKSNIASYQLYNVKKMIKKLNNVVKSFQVLFAVEKSYYGNPLFVLSVAVHRILHKDMSNIIMVDLDMIVLRDIRYLYEKFMRMKPTQILGIAYEQQPVYYHLTRQFRKQNQDTLLGSPHSVGGIPGFNAGVKLFNLNAMRKNRLYNSYLNNPSKLKRLTLRFSFKGHLGDQDFFTLLSFFKKDWFYVLPCQWNRQTCVWWKGHGYDDIFHLFHSCPKPYFIIHGNCNTEILLD